MKAFVITLDGNEYSETAAHRCIKSAANHGLDVANWWGVDRYEAEDVMKDNGLEWTWAKNNTANDVCELSGLQQFPCNAKDLRAKIGCSMSHYLLWSKCFKLDEPIVILEHDAVFINDFPKDIKFNGICQLNDPAGATPKGHWWHDQMVARGGEGAFEKTWIRSPHERHIPDGLAGNSAYIIKPWAAQQLMAAFHKYGVWPNDATMCKQLFPYLEEYYPFITKVIQTQSTTME